MDYPQQYYQGWDPQSAQQDWIAKGKNLASLQQVRGVTPSSPSGGGSSNRYVGGIDYSSVPSAQSFLENQLAGEDVALQDYVMAMKAQKKPLDVYTGLETEAGLPALRGTATTLSKEIANIEDVLEGIEPNISARTRESLVTEAQRQGMVRAEKEPLWERLSKFTTNLGRIGDLIGLTSGDIANKTQLFLLCVFVYKFGGFLIHNF